MISNPTGWQNYRSADEEPTVCRDVLGKMVKAGGATVADSWAEVNKALDTNDETLF